MTMSIDGARSRAELVQRASAIRSMQSYGSPRRPASSASRFGRGQVVLSGALGPMRPVAPGQTVRAEISGLGSVTFTLDEPNDKEQV